MRRIIVPIIKSLLVIIVFITATSLSSNYYNFQNDTVTLVTDRNIYIIGEHIHFSALITNKSNLNSKILYIELVSAKGHSFFSEKFFIKEGKSCGSLHISKDMLTGEYFIKAYTRWMRNFDVNSYAFVPIKIINPSVNEVFTNTSNGTNGNGNGNTITITQNDIFSKNIKINNSSQTYKRREDGFISFSFPESPVNISWVTLSIVPKGAAYCGQCETYGKRATIESVNFLPEENGIIISGNVETKTKKENKANSTINLSLLGEYPDFVSTQTDLLGKFYYNLPFIFGKKELYFGTREEDFLKVKIDNDFCTKSLAIKHNPFELSDTERHIATSFAKNLEVEKHFVIDKNKTQTQDKNEIVTKPFYGQPDKVFFFDKYIDLLSVKEYFYELIPNVSVKKRNGKNYLIFIGPYPELAIYEPLVLIDNIAVDQVDRILSVNPNLLSRIEIIFKPYYKGEKIYGGVISFFSRKGDLAGIDLPPSDLFIEYNFIQNENCIGPVYKSIPKNIPDTRNTLLWIPNIDLSKSQKISFTTSDTPGDYIILLRGTDANGNFINAETYFTVL
jgi:hypothetical protein